MNVASDFVSQYTARQEYRYSEATPFLGKGWYSVMRPGDYPISSTFQATFLFAELWIAYKSGITTPNFFDAVRDTKLALSSLEHRISCNENIPTETLRNVLRRAAALCCSDNVQLSIISHLVNIPFQMFTKESIKMGTSLWLGVIHENPRTEPRILMDVTLAWERTIHRKLGIFDPKFK
jgi:phosphatidylinositol 4-kinase A